MKSVFTLFFVTAALALSACSATDLTPAQNEQIPETSNAIIGGTDVPDDHEALKHIVALYDTASGALCTGTLLGNNLVLTAAHCIGQDPLKMVVMFGNKLTQKSPTARATAAVVSPLWAANQFNPHDTGDIALVKFEGTLPEYFQGLPILPESYVPYLRENTLVLMLGYGMNDGVKKSGSGTLRMVGARIADPKFSATEVVIDQTAGKGACHGDSGGPAIIFIGSQAHVWGVTSRSVGDPDDHCSQYAAYTNATTYLAWIRETSETLLRQSGEGRNNPFNGL